MRNFLAIAFIIVTLFGATAAKPVYDLLERIAPGNANRFEFTVLPGAERFFEISSTPDGRVAVSGNDNVSVATGLGWYLKYYTGNQLCWNNMTAVLPDQLPLPDSVERHTNPLPYTYYLNYCTHSYSMAFWDSDRWQQEIDWMALHGVNMPLMITGAEQVWYNLLQRLGYTGDEAANFVAGPAYQAWWLMNNLEGWGGPVSAQWMADRMQLQQTNLARMAELDIYPVLPGYCGMVPHDAAGRLGLVVADPGLWCGFTRPAFLQPTDSAFASIAQLYYEELHRLYPKARFYSMDPFHEGGNAAGVDLDDAGRAIHRAMKDANPDAVWVVQGWQENPRREMIEAVPEGDMIVLDLWSESTPQWKRGFSGHQWIQCMLLNYGGNVGLHGKMPYLPQMFAEARSGSAASQMRGVGLTMEGIENNPVMYEMMCELPWLDSIPGHMEWLGKYLMARYSASELPAEVEEGWSLLANGIYNCPPESRQQGTTESVFCARPALHVRDASSWANSTPYYDRRDVIRAAALIDTAWQRGFGHGNSNFEYDRVDILRQANAECGRILLDSIASAFARRNATELDGYCSEFMALMAKQDSLLSTNENFTLGRWLDMAYAAAFTPADSALMDLNARLLITTWGNRTAADKGGLRDYGNKEWGGLVGSLYERRWRLWFGRLRNALERCLAEPEPVDWYEVEANWTGLLPLAVGENDSRR